MGQQQRPVDVLIDASLITSPIPLCPQSRGRPNHGPRRFPSTEG